MASRKIGNFEIDTEENFVRIKNGNEGNYTYLISSALHGAEARIATRMFEEGYERGKSDLRRDLRTLLGASK